MLHYFRINDPYRIIGLLVILLILFLPGLIDIPPLTFPEFKTLLVGSKVLDGSALYTEIIDSSAPLTGWVSAIITWIFGDSLLARHILAFLLLFFNAAVLGVIFIDKKAFPDSSFIPSLIFGILCAFSFDTVSLSGELMGTFFLLMTLNSLFKEIEFREENFEIVLKTGMFIGIASLFEFSFSIYVFAILIILVLYTRTSGRKILLLFIGYLLPHLLLISVYYIKGGVTELWNYFYLPNLAFRHIAYVGTSDLLILLAVPLLFFIASLVLLNRESRFTKYQSQLLAAMFFWTIFSIIQVYFSKAFRPHSFLPVMIGFAFFISHFFLTIMRRKFAELSFWIFLLGIVAVSYYMRYSEKGVETYTNLVVPEANAIYSKKKIVVLADSLPLYRGNSISTPFLDWKLSREIFENPDYYDNIVRVNAGFQEKPELVIDPQNLMQPFFERIPELKKQYVKTADGYQRVD